MMTIGTQHRPLRELVADRIVQMIMDGDLKPGERLYEEHIAQELGVSRNPVRESIRALEATGLVEVLPRRGAHVTVFDNDDLKQLLEVRVQLEGFAAELAATNHNEKDIAELDRCISEGSAASKANDRVTAAECHRAFHEAVESAAGNPHITSTVAPLRQQTELVFSMLADQRSDISWDEHRRVRAAIVSGDAAAARTAASEHIQSVIASLSAT